MSNPRIAINAAALLTMASLAPAFADTLTVYVLWEPRPVATRMLERSERVASDVLHRAGIQVRWQTGPLKPEVDPRTYVVVRVLDKPLQAATNLSSSPLGFSLVGAPVKHAAVFWDEVQRTAAASNVEAHTVLGCAIAHEIGHLLMASTRHSPQGVMRDALTTSDFRSATQGRLQFSRAEAAMMQINLHSAGTESFALDRTAPRGWEMRPPSSLHSDPRSIP